jgi:hypothetical protein
VFAVFGNADETLALSRHVAPAAAAARDAPQATGSASACTTSQGMPSVTTSSGLGEDGAAPGPVNAPPATSDTQQRAAMVHGTASNNAALLPARASNAHVPQNASGPIDELQADAVHTLQCYVTQHCELSVVTFVGYGCVALARGERPKCVPACMVAEADIRGRYHWSG